MLTQSESIGNLAMALAKAQNQMSLAQKSVQNPHLRNSYADLTSVWDACRDALTDNELSLSQLPTTELVDGTLVVGLTSMLMHSSGEYVSTRMHAPAIGNRGVNDLQAMGSVITYLRRYALSAMVGVATGDDDDGNGGGNAQQRQQTPSKQRKPVVKKAMQPQKPNGSNKKADAAPQIITESQLKSLHAAGRGFYGDEWETKRGELVAHITKNRTSSRKDLTVKEAEKLIGGINRKADEAQQAQGEIPPLFPEDEQQATNSYATEMA